MTGLVFFSVVLLLFSGCVVKTSDSLRLKKQTTVDDENAILEVFNNCRCVNYFQCDENDTVITNGENLLDLRLSENVSPKPSNGTRLNCKGGKFEGEIVCCRLENSTSTEVRNPVQIDFTNETTTSTRHRCGLQRTKINVRIFADEEVNPIDGEFPWITAIFKKKKNGDGWKFYCSGALIHPKVILTANHYFHKKDPEDFKIILNGNIELPKVGTRPNDERNVAEIVNHPRYYGGALYNDGALLILDEPYESTRTNSINSLCLPPDNVVIDSGRCLVAGWGKGSVVDGHQILKKVELPLVNFKKCQDLLRKTRLGSNFNLHNSFICAGGEKDKDACKGDGGSPLMCLVPSETRYFYMGIVSWGIGCGEVDVPGVYASTAKMKSWILEELNKRGFHL